MKTIVSALIVLSVAWPRHGCLPAPWTPSRSSSSRSGRSAALDESTFLAVLRSTLMRSAIVILVVAFGIAVGAIASAQADRVPTDLWAQLDRERY